MWRADTGSAHWHEDRRSNLLTPALPPLTPPPHAHKTTDMDGVRVDTWVEPGAEVSPHYDSLLGKLMVWAPTRALAVERIQKAIDATRLRGAPNNVEFLRALVRDPRFVAGERMEGGGKGV